MPSEAEDVIAMNKCLSNITLSSSFHSKFSKNKWLLRKLGKFRPVCNIAALIANGKDNQYCYCTICKSGSLNLSNIEIVTLQSHTKLSEPDNLKTKDE